MKISIVGTGYVGLVTGTCFAEVGNQVTCVDISQAKVEEMQSGVVPIYEPHLDGLFQRNIREGRLSFTTDLAAAVRDTEVIFLALPTPPNEDGSADLSAVLKVADDLSKLIDHYVVVVNKSTVPVGMAERVNEAIAANCKSPVDVVSNPEFLREGCAVDDFMKPDRVVIGSSSERANKVMKQLYAPFVRQGNPIYFMDSRSAELTKYAANAFLATKISFMNEMANLAEQTGANIDSVRIAMGADDRIGKRFLFSGIGYGGSCFPKDVRAVKKMAEDQETKLSIIDAVLEANERQKAILLDKLMAYYDGDIKGKTFAMWGLAFKPDTDDIREAPALFLIARLTKAGAKIVAFDPQAMKNVKELIGDQITLVEGAYEACKGVDALLIATEWAEFRTPDFDKLAKAMKSKTIFDGRNLYDLKQMEELGFYYNSIGRPTIEVHENKSSAPLPVGS